MSKNQAKNSFGEIHMSQGIDEAFHSLSHYPLLVYNLENFPLYIFNNFHNFPTSNGRLACEEIMQALFSFRLVNKITTNKARDMENWAWSQAQSLISHRSLSLTDFLRNYGEIFGKSLATCGKP